MRAVWVALVAASCGRLDFAGPCDAPWGPPIELANPQHLAMPAISADDLELFLSDGTNLWVETRADRTQVFGAPTELAIPSVTYAVSDPSISRDGRTIYFTAHAMGNAFVDAAHRTSVGAPFDAPIATHAFGNGSIDGDELAFYSQDLNTDLMDFERTSTGEQFPLPAPVGGDVDAGTNLDFDPSIAFDGLSLYFTSTRAGTHALYFTTRPDAAAAFGPVSALPIALAGDLDNAAISADTHHLYFDWLDSASTTHLMMMSRCE